MRFNREQGAFLDAAGRELHRVGNWQLECLITETEEPLPGSPLTTWVLQSAALRVVARQRSSNNFSGQLAVADQRYSVQLELVGDRVSTLKPEEAMQAIERSLGT